MEMSNISVFAIQDQTEQSRLSIVRSGKNGANLTQSEKILASSAIATIAPSKLLWREERLKGVSNVKEI